MYLYYQANSAKNPETGKGEAWKAVKDSPESRASLKKQKVDMVSMLAISTTDRDADYEQLKYRGDLYFDIDNADLAISIASTKELVNKLKAKGVHNITVYLSGKKGFHVTVPSKVFFSGSSAVKWLPYIYGNMAFTNFEVEGLDHNVYSGGQGRLWRQPNVKRKDNGKYKVPVRLEDLSDMDVEKYVELSSTPNHELEDHILKTEPTFSLEMASLFEESAVIVRKDQESKESYRYESTPELEMLTTVPGCIKKLALGQDVKDGANFNRAAMNLAGYLKSANRIGSDFEDELVEDLSSHNNYNSATYTNDRARKTHIKGALRRASKDRSMGCNPAYILSTVDKCGGCVICDGTLSKDKPQPVGEQKKNRMEADGLRHNIFESGLAYYKEYGPKTTKALTTFTLEPVNANLCFNKESDCFRREALKCTIKYATGAEGVTKMTSVMIEEDAWDSPSLFKKQFKGIDNIAITCSEDDLADLRHYIMSKYSDIDHSIRTQTIGLTVQAVPFNGRVRRMLVYTEPGYTAAGNSMRAPVHFEENDMSVVVGAPCIHKAPDLSADNPSDVRIAKELFKINDPWICASLVGWMASTALKPHIMGINNEFPLLGITGRPGTGKTTLASLVADIAGCTYGQTGEPASANSSQAFIERYIAGSTSTPRILDEMNAPAIRANPKLVETVKGVWNGLEVGKGTIGGSAAMSAVATRSVKLTGPVAYISEQPQQDDALRQRSIEVILDMKCHGISATGAHIPRSELDPHVRKTIEAFEYVSEHEQRHKLRGIGKAIIHKALDVDKTWVSARLSQYAEVVRAARCHGRQKYGWRVVMVGLDLYELALRDSYGIDVSEEIKVAKASIIDRLLDKEVTDNGSDNCNNEMLQFIANQSKLSAIEAQRDNVTRDSLPCGFAYQKTDRTLKLCTAVYWAVICRNARSSNTYLKYRTEPQFITAIRTEAYFISYRGGELILDLALLKEAGIPTEHFYAPEEYVDFLSSGSGVF